MKTTYFLDLGNTRWKYLCGDAHEVFRFVYQDDPLAGMLEVLQQLDLPADFVIASVRNEQLNLELQAYLGSRDCHVRWITWEDCRQLQTAYEDPAALGIDRYLNMLGALQGYQLPLIVVSAGTALTVDAMDGSGKHLGGVIFPGIQLLRQVLSQKTDKINIDFMADNDTIFAHNTGAAVSTGVANGFKSAVEGIVKNMIDQLGNQVTVILTGGDAHCLADIDFENFTQTDDMLLFNGLRYLSGKY